MLLSKFKNICKYLLTSVPFVASKSPPVFYLLNHIIPLVVQSLALKY